MLQAPNPNHKQHHPHHPDVGRLTLKVCNLATLPNFKKAFVDIIIACINNPKIDSFSLITLPPAGLSCLYVYLSRFYSCVSHALFAALQPAAA